MLSGSQREISVSSTKNLRMLFYLIGYRSQGESIVILFIDTEDGEVKYSIVNDCYVYEHENLTCQILDKHSARPVTILCWTHPDLDHSVGLFDVINDYCTEDTLIILPEYFHNRDTDVITVNDEDEKNVLDKIFSLNTTGKPTLTHISVSRNSHEIDRVTFVGIDETTLDVSVDALTPHSDPLSRAFYAGKKFKLKNDVSISTILNVDNYYIYLGGDITEQMIMDTPSGILKQCRFVKVPHHGSNTAAALLDYLPENIDSACFTTKTKKLPVQDVLNDYKDISQCIAATGAKDRRVHRHGIVLYEFDFSGDEIHVDVTPYDNGYVLGGGKYSPE